MLETRPPNTYSSTLIPFEPRQVTLARHHHLLLQTMKNQTLENGHNQTLKSTTNSKDKSKKKYKKTGDRDSFLLNRSIAAYLEQSGFAKTLAAFRSEAQFDVVEGSKVHALDLVTYYQYLDSSWSDSKRNTNGNEELGLQKDDIAEKFQQESKYVVPMESMKKKRKKSKGSDDGAIDEKSAGPGEFTKCVTDYENTVSEPQMDESNKKDKKKKQSKLASAESNGEVEEIKDKAKFVVQVDSTVSEPQMDESNKKSKDKKKKKSKSISTENNGEKKVKVEEEIEDKPKDSISLVETNSKHKDVKKKKSKSISGSLAENVEDGTSENIGAEKKSSKKRKRSTSELNESQPEDRTLIKESKTTIAEVSEEVEGNNQQLNAKTLLESDKLAGKKRKTENGEVDSKKSQNSSDIKQPDGVTITKLDMVESDNLERNGWEGSAQQNSTKKQHNSSAEPKTVNAFQRVKVEKVEFADDRLQDNSYWAKSGAEIGYGAKAQEVLGQVRGRNFRHEKTKKKRGSYRGGQIDMQSHSVKFNYSDEE